jgi:hypothetical protein
MLNVSSSSPLKPIMIHHLSDFLDGSNNNITIERCQIYFTDLILHSYKTFLIRHVLELLEISTRPDVFVRPPCWNVLN